MLSFKVYYKHLIYQFFLLRFSVSLLLIPTGITVQVVAGLNNYHYFFLNQIPWGNLHRGSSDSDQLKTDLRKEICKELLDMSNSDNYQKINFLEIQTCFCSLRWLPECWFSYCCGYYICESVSFQGFHISGEWRIEVGKAKITQTFLFLPRFNCSSLRNTFCITVSL